MANRVKPIENIGAKVLFPRTVLQGINADKEACMPEKSSFSKKEILVPETGKLEILLEQTATPRMVFQLIQASSLQQFDDYLGKLLGMHDTPSYVNGRTDFMVRFTGQHDYVQLTQQNHEQIYANICHMQDQAALWWHLYGNI